MNSQLAINKAFSIWCKRRGIEEPSFTSHMKDQIHISIVERKYRQQITELNEHIKSLEEAYECSYNTTNSEYRTL